MQNGCMHAPTQTKICRDQISTCSCTIEISFLYVISLFLFIFYRCIAVRTTLSDEVLESAGPTLIRDDIGSVSLDDILKGGSDAYSM